MPIRRTSVTGGYTMPDKYTFRRTILGVVRDCEPAAAEFSDIRLAPVIAMNAALADADVAKELVGLVGAGYLRDLRPGRIGLWRITLKGRLQIDRETDLDEYLWGQYASRFAGPADGGK